jgi:hypothetical protein
MKIEKNLLELIHFVSKLDSLCENVTIPMVFDFSMIRNTFYDKEYISMKIRPKFV